MKEATLVLIVQGDTVILGEKKRGEIGTGTLNGPGGKIEPEDEGSFERCLIRETKEEWDIDLDPEDLELRAIITFFAGNEPDFRVRVYRTTKYSGLLKETDDTWKPEPYPLTRLPFDRMLESDRAWIERVLLGEKFTANAFYHSRAKDFDRIEFFDPDF